MDGNEGRNVIILVIHEKSNMSHILALVTLVNPLNQNNVVGVCCQHLRILWKADIRAGLSNGLNLDSAVK